MNGGQLDEAKKIFNALIAAYPKLIAAYLGRGTAYALAADFSNVSKK